ncbi:hypothetical protein EQH27_08615 [Streptococcus pneumoniae]|uniref:Uncharacterized protein n=1 Tax=Streptococcus pneumoniae TaxID=1313 RepID=A0A237IZI2_STREE|nr:hypothetical protein CWI64_04275 [Streptococcus pneumoniae]EHZ93855.1 hypothetical protein SPAR140_1712 [Streptococcus pneumoniae EU-NP05]EJG43644.1 hypothetical protein AMCSP13_002076 [Streptococcus pneumoniae 2070335]OYK99498.1 hypothetical protein AJ86_09880 [Streptococcus pneumoniae E709]OYL04046.1 hypothetical protein AK82_02420 [Streptococcus pneumoniae K2521]
MTNLFCKNQNFLTWSIISIAYHLSFHYSSYNDIQQYYFSSQHFHFFRLNYPILSFKENQISHADTSPH